MPARCEIMKRYALFFVICALSLFFLFSGLFGVHGYFYNNSLRKQIAKTREEQKRLSVLIEALREKREAADTEEALRDSAASLGYYIEGDEVYSFDSPALQEDAVQNGEREIRPSFTGLSALSVAMLAAGAALLVTTLVWFLSNKAPGGETPGDGSSSGGIDGGLGDSGKMDYFEAEDEDLYINA